MIIDLGVQPMKFRASERPHYMLVPTTGTSCPGQGKRRISGRLGIYTRATRGLIVTELRLLCLLSYFNLRMSSSNVILSAGHSEVGHDSASRSSA